MFKRILVALKFGSASGRALAQGAELARSHAAELYVFHALDYALAGQSGESRAEAAQEAAQARFDAQFRPLLAQGQKVLFESAPADPALEICRRARALEADLIVLGCHQNPEKMCLGRIDYVGMTILEKAPCPVLLVPLCE
jgi:nucleotide-binding universal stress UspA family protein